MRTGRLSSAPMAVAFCALLAASVLPAEANAAGAATRVLPLGPDGVASVRIPKESIVDLEPGFEILWYRIVSRDRRVFRPVGIGVPQYDDRVVLGGRTTSLCVNGFHGMTSVVDGTQTVVLHNRTSSGRYVLMFSFGNSDRAAWNIVKSIKARDHNDAC